MGGRMKKSISFIFSLILILFVGNTFSKEKNNTEKNNVSVVSDNTKSTKENLKEILYKLVKQDDYLDEVIEKIQGKRSFSDEENKELLSNIKLIRNNLEHITFLNKNELDKINSDPEISKYTRTIMVYSDKINKKTVNVLSFMNLKIKKSQKGLRNAPISKKTKVKGKNIKQLAAEQKNIENLRKELYELSKSSFKVKATSKWLYVASK